MKLTSNQLHRFYRVFDAYNAYADQRLPIDELPYGTEGADAFKRKIEQLRRKWETPEVLDAFIDQNPANLTDRDLEVARRWKFSLFGLFHVALLPHHTSVFLTPRAAIEVRGLGTQIDETFAPGEVVEIITVLLPFESGVVFAGELHAVRTNLGPQNKADTFKRAEEAQASGKLLTTSDRYIEAWTAVLHQQAGGYLGSRWNHGEPMVTLNAENDDDPADATVTLSSPSSPFDAIGATNSEVAALVDQLLELASDIIVPDDQLAPHHRGPLVGYTGEYRDRRIRELHDAFVTASTRREAYGGYLKVISIRDCDERTLYNLLMGYKKAELEDLALELGIYGLIQETKPRVADAIAQVMLKASDQPFATLCTLKPERLKRLRAFIEDHPDGVMAVDPETLDLDDFPPCIPLRFCVHKRNKYFLVVPCDLLERLKAVDWDEVAVEARIFDDVRKVTEGVVQLRGVETFDAIYSAYCSLKGTALPYDTFKHQLFYLDADDKADFRCFIEDGTWYGVISDLYQPRDNSTALELYQVSHAVMDPRPLTKEMVKGDGAVQEWLYLSPASQAVQAFLDAHVPNGGADLVFAQEVTYYLCRLSLAGAEPEDTIAYLRECGVRLHRHDFLQLWDLLATMQVSQPKWALCGWTPLDIGLAEE